VYQHYRYQASENIYKNFDKVLVIDSGRQVYFGPAQAARAYFEGLGFLEVRTTVHTRARLKLIACYLETSSDHSRLPHRMH